ncbi:MAG TPA: hypothetical protein VMU76_00935 [Acidimicrobiales bacterium]|nr:hypothetical protein [Acidimicrobiales bacterium]
MRVKVGSRLRSVVCETEVIVTRAPASDLEPCCGGHQMLAEGMEPPVGARSDPEASSGTQLGKRYADPDLGLELLVTKGGQGTLTLNGAPLQVQQAKSLPASD